MTFESAYWIVGIILLLALAAFVAKKRILKIDHEAPEHRAKENELYEALGLDTPHTEDVPKDHKKRAREVKIAFESSKQF